MACARDWETLFEMLSTDDIEELDERDTDEPLQDEAEALLDDEVELPLELIGVPFN
jgi:hypothetical protein